MKAAGHAVGVLTVVESLVKAATEAKAADGPGTLIVDGAGLSWAELHERARRMAGVLARLGVGPGCRVGVLGETSTSLVALLQAVWLRGAAFTVLPPPTRAGREAYLAHLAGIQASARFAVVLTDEQGLAGVVPARRLSSLEQVAAGAAPADIVWPDPADLAVLQYTSGSTSSPRGVPVTHANLAANLDAIEAVLGHDAVDPGTARWMSWLPLYHDMGLIGFLALPMSRGCSLVLQPPASFALRPASWLERLSRHRVTCTGGPNFAYAMVTRLLEAGLTADLSSVRHMFSGGEPIDAAMMGRFAAAAGRCGLDPGALVAAYGLAESTLAVSFSPIGEGIRVDERGRVRVGRAVSGTRIRIVENGHIEVRGPSVVSGYWGEPPRESQWLRTGDLGYFADDELVICGRDKDVLFAAGRNVYPQDVEAAAARVPGVRPGGAAAFGVPAGDADDTGDRLVVAVETRAASAELRQAVARTVAAETGMAPADVVTLRTGRLPKTSSGKLRRAETRHRYLTGTL